MNKESNRAQCVKCLDVIESKFTHDFVSCKCGAIFVDGGKSYYRAGGNFENFRWIGDDDSLILKEGLKDENKN